MVTLGVIIFFVLLPYVMYSLGAETYHFCTCEHSATGQVLSTEYLGRKSRHTIFFSYVSADGVYRQAEQEISDAHAKALYPVGSPLKLRYKDGHAFIDNGKENKLWNVLFIFIAFLFWSLMAFLLAQEVRNACCFIFSKLARRTPGASDRH